MMDTIEEDLRNKIEHAFDLKQIFDIFSTFVTAMKSQEKKISQLESDLLISNSKFNELAASVSTIEYNIQGFEILDEDENERPMNRSRPNSHVPGQQRQILLKKQPTGLGNSPHRISDPGNRYETKVNVSENSADQPVPTQPTILEADLPTKESPPNSSRRSQANSPKLSPLSKDPLEEAAELISNAKEKDTSSLPSSRNISPRTTSAVIFPPPHANTDGMISNIPSHDPLDDHPPSSLDTDHDLDSDLLNSDPPLSPSGTSVSSLTLASHQYPLESAQGSRRNSLFQVTSPPISSREDTITAPPPPAAAASVSSAASPSSLQSEVNDLLHETTMMGRQQRQQQQAVVTEEEEEEEDEFEKAMKEFSVLNRLNPAPRLTKVYSEMREVAADQEHTRRERRPIQDPLVEIKYHATPTATATPQESLSSLPSTDPSDKGDTQPSSPQPLSIPDSSPSSLIRRKGLFEPIDREAVASATPSASASTGKKSVGRSKLDPKMTVNNRLVALEETMRAMSDVINIHHKALDTIPGRLKKMKTATAMATPAHIQSQLMRLTNVLDRLEETSTLNAAAAAGGVKDSNSGRHGHGVWGKLGAEGGEEGGVESLSDEFLTELVKKVIELLPPHLSAPPPTPVPSLVKSLSEEEVKSFAKRMISEGHFEEFQKGKPGKRIHGNGPGGGEGAGEGEEDEFLTKGDLHTLFQYSLLHHTQLSTQRSQSSLQIHIPSDSDTQQLQRQQQQQQQHQLISPIQSFSSSSRPSHGGGGGGVGAGGGGVGAGGGGGGVGSYDLKSLSEQLQQSISFQIQNNIHSLGLVTHEQLQSSLTATAEAAKAAAEAKVKAEVAEVERVAEAAEAISSLGSESPTGASSLSLVGSSLEKTIALEKTVGDLQHLVNTLDVSLKKHISSVYLKDKQRENSLQDSSASSQAWRPELERVNENIMKSMNDHKELAKALLIDLQQLQQDILNRVDEQRLASLVEDIDAKIQRQIIEGVDPVNNSLASVIRAVHHKADRREMERLVLERITQTEDTIRRLEEAQAEQESHLFRDCAGGVKCISCGSFAMKHNANGGDTSGHTSGPTSVPNGGPEYEQLLAVLNRHAGLKPLSRQTKPLIPLNGNAGHTATRQTNHTTHNTNAATPVGMSPISKKGAIEQQSMVQVPLYRRAKAVSMMKEIPKIPLVSFGPSSPGDVYRYDQEPSSPSPSPVPSPSSSTSSSLMNSRVRLPRVPSVRSTG